MTLEDRPPDDEASRPDRWTDGRHRVQEPADDAIVDWHPVEVRPAAALQYRRRPSSPLPGRPCPGSVANSPRGKPASRTTALHHGEVLDPALDRDATVGAVCADDGDPVPVAESHERIGSRVTVGRDRLPVTLADRDRRSADGGRAEEVFREQEPNASTALMRRAGCERVDGFLSSCRWATSAGRCRCPGAGHTESPSRATAMVRPRDGPDVRVRTDGHLDEPDADLLVAVAELDQRWSLPTRTVRVDRDGTAPGRGPRAGERTPRSGLVQQAPKDLMVTSRRRRPYVVSIRSAAGKRRPARGRRHRDGALSKGGLGSGCCMRRRYEPIASRTSRQTPVAGSSTWRRCVTTTFENRLGANGSDLAGLIGTAAREGDGGSGPESSPGWQQRRHGEVGLRTRGWNPHGVAFLAAHHEPHRAQHGRVSSWDASTTSPLIVPAVRIWAALIAAAASTSAARARAARSVGRRRTSSGAELQRAARQRSGAASSCDRSRTGSG